MHYPSRCAFFWPFPLVLSQIYFRPGARDGMAADAAAVVVAETVVAAMVVAAAAAVMAAAVVALASFLVDVRRVRRNSFPTLEPEACTKKQEAQNAKALWFKTKKNTAKLAI